MNALKSFLKPNRWKVGIIGVFVLVVLLEPYSLNPSTELQYYPVLTIYLWIINTVLITLIFPEMIIAFPQIVGGSSYDLLTELYHSYRGSYSFLLRTAQVLTVPYWYLLACILYFIFQQVRKIIHRT